MKNFVEMRIRIMLGLTGDTELHPELVRFANALDTRYRNCGMPNGIKEEHLPLVMCLIEMQDIPLIAPPKERKSQRKSEAVA